MAHFYSPSQKKKQVASSIHKVTVTGLDAFGQGVAQLNGKTVFIHGALPGEEVEIKLIEDKRQYAKAKVVKQLTVSQSRVKPLCRHYPACGGCQQQHATIELQRSSKLTALLHLLSQQTGAHLPDGDLLFHEPYHYRRRVRLGLQYDNKQRQLVMGFRRENSNNLIDIMQCPVMCSELEQLLVPLKECLTSLKTVNKLGHIELVSVESGIVMILRHLAQLPENDQEKLVSFAKEYTLSLYIATNDAQQQLLFGTQPFYLIDNLKLFFNPQGFIQVNGGINAKMVEKVLHWLDIQNTDRVLDLFCGVGNFTLPIAKKAGLVVGVEGVASLVELARHNAEFNQLNNAEFFHENLEEKIEIQPWAKQHFNKVILDPARAGALGVIAKIVQLSPEIIVYVSCNPATLARDCKPLLDAGYQLKEVCMVDMFPNTGHLESMVLLTKK